VLIAQSQVGREGLNLHEQCRDIVLLHPEWNPGVVEQQIGRVDRLSSRWCKDFDVWKEAGAVGDPPRIEIRPIMFMGTYMSTTGPSSSVGGNSFVTNCMGLSSRGQI
jgi:hypothetical protein